MRHTQFSHASCTYFKHNYPPWNFNISCHPHSSNCAPLVDPCRKRNLRNRSLRKKSHPQRRRSLSRQKRYSYTTCKSSASNFCHLCKYAIQNRLTAMHEIRPFANHSILVVFCSPYLLFICSPFC
jgi:hypothetical protein